MRKALDMDYELGEELIEMRQKEISRVMREDEPIELQDPIEGLMAVSIDATKVRHKLGEKVTKAGKKTYEIGFKDAKVAAVSAVVWDKRSKEAKCVESSYVSAIEEADFFFDRIWVEMSRRGSDLKKQPMVFIGDGAEWIWNRTIELANVHSIEILDFYHATEHLSDLCKVLYGEETEEYWKHFKQWKTMFFNGKAKRVLAELQTMYRETRDEKARKALHDEIRYFKKNLSRMKYKLYRRLRLPIGSGTVESACKNVIGGRLKQGGMTWSEDGASGMLQIRCSQESSRFLSDFQRLMAA
jgi:hypothetical protein